MKMVESSVAELWARMSTAYFAGDLALAQQIGDTLLKRDPRHVRALHCLSVLANRRHQKQLEFELLHKVLSIDPTHVQALVGVANIIRALGKTDEAAELCLRAIRRLPSYANAHNSLGLCRLTQNRPAEAAKCFHLALAYQPSLAAARQNLTAALRQIPDPDQALIPSKPEDFENLGWLYVFQRRRTEATAMFEKGLALDPNAVRLLQALADQLRQIGDAERSSEIWKRLIHLEPHSAQHACGLGYALQDLGRFDEAVEAFERSLQLNPNQGDAYLGIATSRKARREHGELVLAMKALRGRLAATEQVYLSTALSKFEDDLGEYEAAVKSMDEANSIAERESGLYQGFPAEWYSRLVESNAKTFSHKFFSSPPDAASQTDRPVFLIGLPRSGTTLTEQMLAAHPQIAAAGELPFWSDQESLQVGGLSSAIEDHVRSAKLAADYLEVLESVGPNALRVTDKMPDNFAHIGFIHAMLPNARFIHCRRNPIDNCLSIYMTPFRNRPPMAYRREDILLYLRMYQAMMRHWNSVIPEDRLLDVDYEVTVSDPEGSMRRIIDFLGLEWDERCLQHWQSERSVNTPSSWQTRQPIYSTSVERWRRYEPWLGPFRELI